jgi:hypothetical protein
VVSTEHNRDGAGRRNFANLPIDLTVAMLNTARHDRRIARINGGKDTEWINANLQ